MQVRVWMTAAVWLLALLVLATPTTPPAPPAKPQQQPQQLAMEVRAFSVNSDDKDPDEDPDVVIRFASKPKAKAVAPKKR